MKFWFSEESSFDTPNTDRTYTIDIANERIERNMEYNEVQEFMGGPVSSRQSSFYTVNGEIIAELTFQNEAWSRLFGCLMGSRTVIDNYKFKLDATKSWGVVIGYLDNDLAADSTSITINGGDESTLFDNVEALIINEEFITVSSVAANVAAGCGRGAESTTARVHYSKDLVYGLVADGDRSVVICHRKKVGGFRELGKSLTMVLDRSDILFAYSGMYIRAANFNFRTFDEVNVSLTFDGADSTSNITLVDTAITDTYPIINATDIKVFSEHYDEQLRQLYVQIYNSLTVASHGFASKAQNILLNDVAAFGVITWADDSLSHVLQYEQNTKRHFSLSVSRSNYRMIVALNNVRINTPSHYMDNSLIIQDSAPWYMYTDPIFLFQF